MESRVVGKGLLDKAQGGDQEAFEALVKNHAASLKSFIHFELARRFGRGADAEDVLQETLLRAWQSIHRLRGREGSIFRRWLCMIAKHVIQDRARRLKRERAAFDSRLAIQSPRSKGGKWGCADALLAAKVDPPSKVVRRNERFERLEEAMSTLSPVHRKVVFLARVQGLPIKEVARRIGRSDDATSMLLLRAMHKLKAAFGDTDSLHLPRGRSLEE